MKPAVALPLKDCHLSAPVPITAHPLLTSPHNVRIELSQILKSGGFVHAKRMQRFLQFVVEETLAGRAHEICEYSIGISVFERKESFDPGLDPIVRNDARRLRQKLLEYYHERYKEADEVVIEVPKGGYVPTFRCASRSETTNARRRYRLTTRLTRADGAEVWITDQEFEINENSEELCFGLQLEVRNQRPPVSILPISQSSNQAHRWNRSRERAVK
jgi:hypothetical protein